VGFNQTLNAYYIFDEAPAGHTEPPPASAQQRSVLYTKVKAYTREAMRRQDASLASVVPYALGLEVAPQQQSKAKRPRRTEAGIRINC